MSEHEPLILKISGGEWRSFHGYDARFLRAYFNELFEFGLRKSREARIKALEGAIKEWFATYPCSDVPESYYENTDCEYCSAVNKMYRVLSRLEEV